MPLLPVLRTALRPTVLASVLGLAVAGLAGDPAAACPGSESPCAVEDGRYYVAVPDAAGGAPMPVIVWFHGWQGTGAASIGNRGFVQGWTDAGWLFVAADGREKTWSHVGSPTQARDDVAYVRSVIEDVRRRWPVDGTRVLAAGFSQGGSMVWDVACRLGAPFTHFAPVSGAFWEPLPESACAAGPVRLHHVHGTADTVVPFEGRWIRDTWKQGDVGEGFDVLRTTNACGDGAGRPFEQAGQSCRAWSDCAPGSTLRLCLHDGGHSIPPGWSARVRTWIETTRADG